MTGTMRAPVLPPGLSLIEDPHCPRVTGSRPTRQRVLVRDGVLQGWTPDPATARKRGLRPTAHAVRGRSSTPSSGTRNTAFTQGTASRADLMRDMGTVVLIILMTGNTFSPDTGDHSHSMGGPGPGDGHSAGPVNQCTIIGNLVVPAHVARRAFDHERRGAPCH
ncbi:MAG: hypothetical protein GDA36_12765 [Rhodobacteraceae bacterium]|nr:hypothetical protein [Paracoccaceae bacterium]